MGIDGVGNAPPRSTASTAQAKPIEAPKPSAPPPPAPSAPKPAPTEGYADPKKKPMSITGKYQPPAADQMPPVNKDLMNEVANQRSMAQAGVVGAPSGPAAPPPSDVEKNRDALREAVKKDDDVAVRNMINGDPNFLDGVPAGEKGKALEVLRSGHTSTADKEAMAHIVTSCKSKGELRDVVSSAAGHKATDGVYPAPSQADMHKYDKELTNYHPCMTADLLNPANPSLPDAKGVDPNSLGARYHISDIEKTPRSNMSETVSLAPGDEAARHRFLSKMTQADPARKELHHTNGCGSSVIVASCLQQKDPQKALSKLCAYNLGKEGNNDRINDVDRIALEKVKAKIDGGESISRADVDVIQRTTYTSLNVAKRSTGGNQDSKNIGMPAIQKVMTDSGVGYSGGVPALVDLDGVQDARGRREVDHYVLIKQGGLNESSIYDPWPREGGRQIVSQRGPHGAYDEGAYDAYRHAAEHTAEPMITD